MRGKQLVVAGDSKQLPPTSFFDRSVSDSVEDDDQIDENLRDMESILDALNAKGMHPESLNWHYRSRHENLIAFSNHRIYDGRLITFPTPTDSNDLGVGVQFHHVPNGRYVHHTSTRGQSAHKSNHAEVEQVLELVAKHYQVTPSQSLGVVALGQRQADAIDTAIRERCLIDRRLEEWTSQLSDEPFFVKNLEQVQGDQRDVMIISIGFAKDEHGNLSHNFGPINQEVGKRRINVLITRAKNKIVVVSSIRADDIREDRLKTAGGARLLKQYLDYAERGPIALDSLVQSVGGDFESAFEEHVAREIRNLGYDVDTQIGVSKYRIDLGVVDPHAPGRYLLGIECDGATYHTSKTARDRDRLRQEVLEDIGWEIHRIWSTDWFRNHVRELEKVSARIDSVLSQDRFSKTSPSAEQNMAASVNNGGILRPNVYKSKLDATTVKTLLRSSPSANALRADEYKPTEVEIRGESDLYRASHTVVTDSIIQCVDTEGPIHRELLIRRISAAWGYSRAGRTIASRIDQDIRYAQQQRRIRVVGDFLWPVSTIIVQPRGADRDGVARDIKFVSSEEIQAGLKKVLQHALSLSEDELTMQTARFFDYSRTGKAIRDRLKAEIRTAVNAGLLEQTNGTYRLQTK